MYIFCVSGPEVQYQSGSSSNGSLRIKSYKWSTRSSHQVFFIGKKQQVWANFKLSFCVDKYPQAISYAASKKAVMSKKCLLQQRPTGCWDFCSKIGESDSFTKSKGWLWEMLKILGVCFLVRWLLTHYCINWCVFISSAWTQRWQGVCLF